MKELSIEEKAKAYDEAIKVAQRFYNNSVAITKKGLEDIFPELAESEDERLRKEMIFYFTEEIPQCSIQEHSDKMREFILWLKRQEVECTKLELKAGNSYFCYKSRWERADSETFKKGLIYKCDKDGVLDNFVIKNPERHFIEIKDERIAWLEKQGEHAKFRDSIQVGDKVTRNQDGVLVNLSQLKRVAKPTEKQGEQKSSEEYNITGIGSKHATGKLKEILDKKENPAWSEEDEKFFNTALWHICNSISNGELTDIRCDTTEWFKSLKDRVQPQPQQEWSEEDETNASYICAALDCYLRLREERNNTNGQEDLDKARNWLYNKLKYLRPQNTWKPSDEQMEALYEETKKSDRIRDERIVSLYEDLKKLKE